MALGLALGRGASIADATAAGKGIAEGVWTASAVARVAEQHGIDMPIASAVAGIVDGTLSVDAAIDGLLARPFRAEAEPENWCECKNFGIGVGLDREPDRRANLTPKEYFNEIARPTVLECKSDRKSRRHAYLACISVYHVMNYIAEARSDRSAKAVQDIVRADAGEAYHVVKSSQQRKTLKA